MSIFIYCHEGKYISLNAQTKRNLRVHAITRSKIMPKVCSKFIFIVFLVTRKKLIKYNMIIILYSNTLQRIMYLVIYLFFFFGSILFQSFTWNFFKKSQKCVQCGFWSGLQIYIIKRLYLLQFLLEYYCNQNRFSSCDLYSLLYYIIGTVCKFRRVTFG